MTMTAGRRASPLIEVRLYIAGVFRPAAHGRVYENISPVSEEVIGVAADASGEDMRDAIVAARRAFDEGGWATDPALRARCLRQLHNGLERHADSIKETVRAEVGTTDASLATVQYDTAIKHLVYAADLVENYR